MSDLLNFPSYSTFIMFKKTTLLFLLLVFCFIVSKIICFKTNESFAYWIDDDFDTEHIDKVLRIADSLNIPLNFATIPSIINDSVFFEQGIRTLIDSLNKQGHSFLIHPNQQLWENDSSIITIYKNLKRTKELFSNIENNTILVYPGSSFSNIRNHIVTAILCDFGISSKGTYTSKYYKFCYPRLFISITESKTKTYYKRLIKESWENKECLIIGTHSWEYENSSVSDESTPSTQNLYEIINYIDSLYTFNNIGKILKRGN